MPCPLELSQSHKANIILYFTNEDPKTYGSDPPIANMWLLWVLSLVCADFEAPKECQLAIKTLENGQLVLRSQLQYTTESERIE